MWNKVFFVSLATKPRMYGRPTVPPRYGRRVAWSGVEMRGLLSFFHFLFFSYFFSPENY